MDIANPPKTGDVQLDTWLGSLVERLRHMRPIEGDYIELPIITAPGAPGADRVRIYNVTAGGGKTKLMAIFESGAEQQLGAEP